MHGRYGPADLYVSPHDPAEPPDSTYCEKWAKRTTLFTSQDIRFTTQDDTLYARVLGWPEDRRVTIRSFAQYRAHLPGSTLHITLLAVDLPLPWSWSETCLVVEMPDARPGDHAYVLKIPGAPSRPRRGHRE